MILADIKKLGQLNEIDGIKLCNEVKYMGIKIQINPL